MLGYDALELALEALVDGDKNSGQVGHSWWIAFKASGEHGFSGEILHLHIATPKDWMNVISDIQGWIVAGAGILGAADIASALASAIVIPALAVAWQISSNKDGTYDLYVIKESATWSTRLLSMLFPLRVSFTGFVSDSWHKPPLSLNPMRLLNVFQFSAVRRIANAYRHSPRP
jgi:hypothetical protein